MLRIEIEDVIYLKEFKISFTVFDEKHKNIFSLDKVPLSKGIGAINGFATKKIGVEKKKPRDMFGDFGL